MPELVAALGKALGDRYEVLRQIGEGAHGVVYLARDLRHNRRVAIKVLRVDGSAADSIEMRFVREIHLLASLQHPNILPLHDSGYFGTCLYYVMPYVDGETLRDRMRKERRLPIDEVVSIGRELADALDCAHSSGIVHRDVKPENVLLASGRPLLADFGVAAALHAPSGRRITRTGDAAPGTPAYMSPEQLLGERAIDGRADLYALGCVMHEMLTGAPPFAGPSGFTKRFTEPPPAVCAIRPEVPPSLERVIGRALQREPDSRFSTARELRAALADALTPAARQQRPSSAPRPKPAPRTKPPAATLMPAHETPFVGRTAEIATLTELLHEHRLVTILGQGGVGKSRLAHHVGQLTMSIYRHGVRTVSLDGIPVASLVWAAIGEALGVSASTHDDARSRVTAMLRRRNMLLVLDGFEHLIEIGPQLVELLARAPALRVLVTSRERINVSMEAVLELRGLPASADDAVEAGHDAIQLFVERARHVLPGFTLSDDIAPAVAELCRSVDGLPLAIELAASMLRMIDCTELVTELRKSYDILSTGLRDVPERHRSLGAVFEESWRRLSEEERGALRRLSIFAGPFSRDAATTVGGASFAVLRALSDKSLVHHGGPNRYALHAVVRQHARGRLSENERDAVEDAHARFYGQFVHSRAHLLVGRDQKAAAAELARELPHLRAGWHRAVRAGDEQLIEDYLEGLYQLYRVRSWFREGAAELDIGAVAERATITAARVLARRGKLLYRIGEIHAARLTLARSLRTLRDLGARREMLLPLQTIAEAGVTLGKYRAAERLLRSAALICNELGDRHALGHVLVNLGYALTPQDRADETEMLLREGMELLGEAGDEGAVAVAATSLGALLMEEHRLDEARQVLEHALASSRAVGDERIAASALLNLGSLAAESGDPEHGAALCHESLTAFRAMGVEDGVAASLMILGEIELARNDLAAARRFYLDALRAATSIGADMYVMPVLVRLAELSIKVGEVERAQVLIDCALGSRALDARNRVKAEAMARTLAIGASAPAERARPKSRPVADVVRQLLDSSPQ